MNNVFGFDAKGVMVSVYAGNCNYVKVIGRTYIDACAIAKKIGGNDLQHYSRHFDEMGEQPVWWIFSPHRTRGFSVRTERPDWQ